MKKLLSFILATVLMIWGLAGCTSANNNDNTHQDKSNQDSVVDDDRDKYDGMLVINGEYTIVRSELSNSTTVRVASYIQAQLANATGCEIPIQSDNSEEGDPNAKEIVIGNTARKTEFDRSTLKEEEFYLGVEGNRIIIDAYDSIFLEIAVEKILSVWLTDEVGLNDGILLMNDEICATLNAIPNPLDTAVVVMTQNLRCCNDGTGNHILDRAPRFKAQVEKYQPDIIGVQECTALWRDVLKADFSDKYGIIGVPRDGKNGEGNEILYRLDRFELLENETFWLSNTPDVPSKLADSSYTRICTWALLKDKMTGKTILMTNTHLDTEVINDFQADILLGRFRDMIDKYPMFTTGDFNFKDYSAGYKVFTKSMYDTQNTTRRNLSTINYTYNGYGTSHTHRIDFIFHNALAEPYEYKIITNEFGGYISDHYGIYAKYIY